MPRGPIVIGSARHRPRPSTGPPDEARRHTRGCRERLTERASRWQLAASCCARTSVRRPDGSQSFERAGFCPMQQQGAICKCMAVTANLAWLGLFLPLSPLHLSPYKQGVISCMKATHGHHSHHPQKTSSSRLFSCLIPRKTTHAIEQEGTASYLSRPPFLISEAVWPGFATKGPTVERVNIRPGVSALSPR